VIRTVKLLDLTRSLPLLSRFDASWVIGPLLGLFTSAVVVAQATGIISTERAVILLLSPVLALAAALRPAWLVLLLAATPFQFHRLVPVRALMLLLVVTLLAHLVVRGHLSVGMRSGLMPMLLIVLAARFFPADVSSDAALQARGFLTNFTFYVLLGLLAYNTIVTGDLKVRHLLNALLAGIALTVLMERSGLAVSQAESGGGGIVSIGRNVSYLGAIGFGLAFARLLLPDPEAIRRHRLLFAVLATFFAVITAQAFVRAAWLSCLIVVFLVAAWARKRRYWLLLPLAAAVVLVTPVAKERVLPGYGAGIGSAIESEEFATGRFNLWDALWDEITPALPEGHGYGYTWSLTPERLLGTSEFGTKARDFVYPHNDFLFWTMELGLLGLAAVVLFWILLIRAFRSLSSHGSPSARHTAIVLSAILVTMFIMQMIDNSFAIPAVAELFFIGAGAIFGLASVDRASPPANKWATG
jgi:O-antigen ligase